MSRLDSTTLKGFFETGDIPTQSEYASLIDSSLPNNYTKSSGTGNDYILTYSIPYTALINTVLVVQFHVGNLGATTLKLDSLLIKPLTKNGGLPLIAGDIKANQIYTIAYDLLNDTFEIVSNIKTEAVNLSSTQWSKTIPLAIPFPNNDFANGFTFFTPITDIVSGGTTSYNQYLIAYGIELELSGTGGNGNIFINGISYQLIFDTDLDTTASNFVTSNYTTLKNLGVNIFNLNADINSPFGVKNARIRFCTSQIIANGISYTNALGNLNVTISNPFTGTVASAPDHVLVPYENEPYNGQRLQHNFRVNFGLDSSNAQTVALSLRRFANDSIIGSEIPVFGQADVQSQQYSFITYTANVNDPFVTGGFYFALRNGSGASLDIQDNIGILLQNYFEKPTTF